MSRKNREFLNRELLLDLIEWDKLLEGSCQSVSLCLTPWDLQVLSVGLLPQGLSFIMPQNFSFPMLWFVLTSILGQTVHDLFVPVSQTFKNYFCVS